MRASSPPHRDDDELTRRSCPDAGEVGHWTCGVCVHDKLYADCEPCLLARLEAMGGADADAHSLGLPPGIYNYQDPKP